MRLLGSFENLSMSLAELASCRTARRLAVVDRRAARILTSFAGPPAKMIGFGAAGGFFIKRKPVQPPSSLVAAQGD